MLRGGIITYATELKVALAYVPQELVDEYSVISPEVAEAMAVGARQACGSTWALSLTGVAGPDPQDGHPVGEVYIACAGPNGVTSIRAMSADSVGGMLSGDRNSIRLQAVEHSLQLLLQQLTQ